MITRIANLLSLSIGQNNNMAKEDIEKINYILIVILDEFTKLLILFILFLLTGKLNLFLYSLFILSTIRIFSGGTHFNNSISCLIFSICFFILAVFIFPLLSLTRVHYIILSAASLIIIALRSPMPSPMRPIKNMKRRYYLKILSILFTLIWLYILFFIIKNEVLFKCGIGTILLQALQLLIREVNI